MKRLENIILRNLIHNDEYTRKVLPFIKPDYFSTNSEKTLFKEIFGFIDEYKNLPTHEALTINITEKRNLNEEVVKDVVEILNDIETEKNEPVETPWLIDQTEKFCQDKALFNAITESVTILEGQSKSKTKGEIPKLLSDALGVSFDNNVGHDYMNDTENRYEAYHRVESRIKFDLDIFNKITKGGLPIKTLNVALAGTGVGKSLFMCHVAAGCLSQGLNVLYITMEMAEEKIAERIDANLLNMNINELHTLSKDDYLRKFSSLRNKTQGKLIIKEYPTASASTLHFRALLNDLALKKTFRPDIIFVDYLNICCSARLKPGANVNSYMYIKSIAEELRGLAVEFCLPIVTATQTNRTGFTNSDPGLEDTSESFGLPATADFMFALVTNEQLEGLNQILVKQLKNRYSDPNHYKRFVLGIDKAKMRLYDVEQSAQKDIIDSGQDEDKPINTFGMRERRDIGNKFDKIKV
jgi:replicative DNA helicase